MNKSIAQMLVSKGDSERIEERKRAHKVYVSNKIKQRSLGNRKESGETVGFLPDPDEQSPMVFGHTPDWQDILWREWRHCEDEAYAQHLFKLVSQTTLGWRSRAILALAGTLYGLLAGYLFGLIAINRGIQSGTWDLTGVIPLGLAWGLGVVGGITGLLVSRWSSWRLWLGLLTPNVFANKMGGFGTLNLGMIAGFITGLAGFGFFGGLIAGALSGLTSGEWNKTQTSAVAGGVGAIVAHAVIQGDWLGVGLGLGVGVWFGVTWGSGPLSLLLSWLGLLFGSIFFGLSDWLAGWLAIGVGLGLGVIPNMVGRGINFSDAYKYRSWYFWWRGQPSLAKVGGALHLAQAVQSDPEVQEVWSEPLRRLKKQKDQADQPADLITGLQSINWVERFTARHALITLGGEAVAPLRRIAADPANPLQQVAFWLLTSIEQETTNRLAWRARAILCPHCLTRFGSHSVSLSWGISFTYYGCRACSQSRKLLEVSHVAIILDTDWIEGQARQGDRLRVNWFQCQALFDFDWVEIIQASDEEVERFAVQIGNDTDPFRKPRYKRMRCLVSSACNLSENTLRILKRTFGTVQRTRAVSR